VRISEHVLYNAIAALWFRIGEPVKDAIALRIFDAVIQVTLFLVAKRFAVGDKKLKVARVRLIDMRIVNLIDDTVAEREPKPATCMIGRTHALFRARSPARLDPGRAKGHRIVRRTHALALDESNPNSKISPKNSTAVTRIVEMMDWGSAPGSGAGFGGPAETSWSINYK